MPKAGELWLAEIPFTSGMASKLRPVLALWEDMADVVVAAVTKAAPRSPAPGETITSGLSSSARVLI